MGELACTFTESSDSVLQLCVPETQEMRPSPGPWEHGDSRHLCSSLQVMWNQPSQFLTVIGSGKICRFWRGQLRGDENQLSRTDGQGIWVQGLWRGVGGLENNLASAWDHKDSKSEKEWERPCQGLYQLWVLSIPEIKQTHLGLTFF